MLNDFCDQVLSNILAVKWQQNHCITFRTCKNMTKKNQPNKQTNKQTNKNAMVKTVTPPPFCGVEFKRMAISR